MKRLILLFSFLFLLPNMGVCILIGNDFSPQSPPLPEANRGLNQSPYFPVTFSSSSDVSLETTSSGTSSVYPYKTIKNLESELYDMGEQWTQGHLIELITTTAPPIGDIKLGQLWESYGFGGNIFPWFTGKRWHQEAYGAMEVKNVLSQKALLDKLKEIGGEKIEEKTGYKVKQIQELDLLKSSSAIKDFGLEGVIFKLESDNWEDYWENWIIVLPHLDVSDNVAISVITIGTHSDKLKATELGKELNLSMQEVLDEIKKDTQPTVSDNWQDYLKELIFPEKESLTEEEERFLSEKIEEWQDLGFSEEEIKKKLDIRLSLMPVVHEEMFYTPLGDSYWYGMRQELPLRLRKNFYKRIDRTASLIEEGKGIGVEGAGLDEISSLRPILRGVSFEKENSTQKIRYNLTGAVAVNGITFPITGEGLERYDSLSFYIKSSTKEDVLFGTEVEASNAFRLEFDYLDKEGNLKTISKRFDKLTKIELSGNYQKVSIPLSAFEGVNWAKVKNFRIYFNSEDMGQSSATLFFKNIVFASEGLGSLSSGEVAKKIITLTKEKEYVEKEIKRPLILSLLEDRNILEGFNQKVEEYQGQGIKFEDACKKAKEDITQWQSDYSLIPFVEELMVAEERDIIEGISRRYSFDKGVFDYWMARLKEDGAKIENLKQELAVKISMIGQVEKWAAPRKIRGEYQYPDNPFMAQQLNPEGFLSTTGQGYLKFFKDTYDEVSGLWYDNSMEIGAENPVISLPGIAGGLTSIPLLVEYGVITEEEGYEMALKALKNLTAIQRKQKKYEEEFIPYLENRAKQEGVLPEDYDDLSFAQKMNALDMLPHRRDYEIEFLNTRWEPSKGKYKQGESKLEFLREYSPIYRYGRWGFMYRYLTATESPERLVKETLVNDLSPMDTAYVVLAALTVGSYFKHSHPEVWEKSKKFYDNINWPAFINVNGKYPNRINMGWLPERIGEGTSSGYLVSPGERGLWYEYSNDEGMMAAFLAVSSDTHPVEKEVFYSLVKEKASYGDYPEYILSPTGSLWTYNLLDLWFDFSDKVAKYPNGEVVNWDKNRRIAVLTNRAYSQKLAKKEGLVSYGPYSWPIDTMYTPDGGLIMGYGFAHGIVEGKKNEDEPWSLENTKYTKYIIPTGVYTSEGAIIPQINPEGKIKLEPVVGMNGYPGSILNSLHAYLGWRKLMQTDYNLWGEYGTRDSFSLDKPTGRTEVFYPNLWNSYDQMRGLNLFNLLSMINGKASPRDIIMGNEFIQKKLKEIGFEDVEEVNPIEITQDVGDGFKTYLDSASGDLVNAINNENVLKATNVLRDIIYNHARTEGEFGEIISLIKENINSENYLLSNYLLAELKVAEVLNIAKAATGETYQALYSDENVDVQKAIAEFMVKSKDLYQEAEDLLSTISEAVISKEFVQLKRALELVIRKNKFDKLDNVIDSYGWLMQVVGENDVPEEVAKTLYKYDYDGELSGVYTLEQVKGNLSVVMKNFEPLTEEFQLEPTLPEDAGILSSFSEFVTEEGYTLEKVMEELRVQSVLKPYVEKCILQGENLNVTDPSGTDSGFLTSIARKVEGGLHDGNMTIDEAINWIKLNGRVVSLLQRLTGHKFFDIKEKSHDRRWLNHYVAEFASRREIGLERVRPGESPWDFINRMQKSNRQYGGIIYPANYLIGTNISNAELSHEVRFNIKGVNLPSLKIEGDKEILLKFGDLSAIDGITLWAKGTDESSSFDIRIKNAKGEEAVFRVEGLSNDKWQEVNLPIWGPYQVNWIDDSKAPYYLKNSTWKRWLTLGNYEYKDPNAVDEVVFEADPKGLKVTKDFAEEEELKIYMVKDNISDWSNIESIEIEQEKGAGPLYLSGIYRENSDIEKIDLREDFDKVKNILRKKGNAILVHTKPDEAEVSKPGTGCPNCNPGSARAGFTTTIGDWDVVIIGMEKVKELALSGTKRYYRVKFIIPELGQNVLKVKYDFFINHIWDGNPAEILQLYGTKEYR